MLPYDQLETAIAIQKDCYQLLQWLRQGSNAESLTYFESHDSLPTTAESARRWLIANDHALPWNVTPERGLLPKYGNYLASFLTTSFSLGGGEPEQVDLRSGPNRCRCDFCWHMMNAPSLKTRKLGKREKAEAREKRITRVLALAEEEGRELTPERAAELASAPFIVRWAAYSAYGQILLERINGSPGGTYAMLLWRQIAWYRGPLPGFELKADGFRFAEERLIAEMDSRRWLPDTMSRRDKFIDTYIWTDLMFRFTGWLNNSPDPHLWNDGFHPEGFTNTQYGADVYGVTYMMGGQRGSCEYNFCISIPQSLMDRPDAPFLIEDVFIDHAKNHVEFVLVRGSG